MTLKMAVKMIVKMTVKMTVKNNFQRQKYYSVAVIVLLIGVFNPGTPIAQQVADTEFRYENKNPAFALNKGPKLLIDKAHSPYVARGSYEPFLKLVREDGFQTSSVDTKFTAKTLTDTQILVVVNA